MGGVRAQTRPWADVVERESEQARVDAFLGALPEGARALLVRGEPGIGKTSVWRAAVEDARGRGHGVLVARPAEEEMSLPLGGLVDLLGGTAADEARLDEHELRLAQGRWVLGELRRLTRTAPLVLALDDLQWLDIASARALRYALRRLDRERVGVLATIRRGHGDPLTVVSALPPGRAEELDLGPLRLGAMRTLLSGTVTSISRPSLQRIHRVSGGNPLYAIELARYLADDPDALASDAPALPDSLMSVLGRRLETVPAELAPLLQTTSALGRAPVRELRRLLPDADVEALLAAATERDLLVVGDDLEVRFTHPLLGSAVYGRIGPLARRTLHERLAELAADPDLRARHLALSTDEADEAVAALLEASAGRARQRGAADVAAELAGDSHRLTPAGREEDGRRRALLEIEQRAAAGEVSRALDLADRLIGELSPGPARAEALAQRASLDDSDRVASVRFLEQALADAPEPDRLRARLLVELVSPLALFVGDPARAIECGEEAVEIAGRLGDEQLWLVAAAHLGYVETLAGSPRPARLVEALGVEERVGSPVLSEGPRVMLGKQLLWGGELERAQELFEAAYEHDARRGNERQRPYRLYDLALAAIAGGDFTAAEELVRRAGEAAQDAEDSFGERLLLVPRGQVEAWLGDGAAARATAERLLTGALRHGAKPGQMLARRILGLVALSEGEADEAAWQLAEAAERHHELGIRHPGAFPVLPDAIEACAGAGDLADAELLLDRLAGQARALEADWPRAAAAAARGAVLLAQGEGDEAARTLAAAASAFERLGYRPDAARARLLEGRALMREGRRSRAGDVLGEARACFAEMRAAAWEARAAEELDRVSPGRASGELTPTERRIAGLVAEGLKNREIAQTVFLSVATVEAHLTRIYRKLGIRSRSELTRLVADGTVRLGNAERANEGAGPAGVGESR